MVSWWLRWTIEACHITSDHTSLMFVEVGSQIDLQNPEISSSRMISLLVISCQRGHRIKPSVRAT